MWRRHRLGCQKKQRCKLEAQAAFHVQASLYGFSIVAESLKAVFIGVVEAAVLVPNHSGQPYLNS